VTTLPKPFRPQILATKVAPQKHETSLKRFSVA
jgi:hypothetical protein